MKKILGVLAVVFAIMMSSNVAFSAEPITGIIFKEAAQPGGGAGSVSAPKVGQATCKSFFGIVALGNCSIKQAMLNGKISNLSYYDEEVTNILGFKKITVKAYGQ